MISSRESNNMYSRKLALSIAKQYRTCPPPAVMDSPENEKYVEQHLAVCPYCSTRARKDGKNWSHIADKVKNSFISADRAEMQSEPAAGQLRYLSTDLCKWSDGYFYNPPMVLILRISSEKSDVLEVAQVYNDIVLAAPGDLILDKEQSGIGDIFIECWNRYSLKRNYLEPTVGHIGEKVLEAVKSIGKDPGPYPPWAVQPRPLEKEDYRISFRELERQVSHIFSLKNNKTLSTHVNKPRIKLAYSSTRDAQRAIKDLKHDITWLREPENFDETLFLAGFPADALQMAAKDTDAGNLVANTVFVKQGKIKNIVPCPVEIYSQTNAVSISGKISDLPEVPAKNKTAMFALYHDDIIVYPIKSDWDDKNGSFLAKFNISAKFDWTLLTAIIYDLV